MSRDASPVRQSKLKCGICKFVGCKTKDYRKNAELSEDEVLGDDSDLDEISREKRFCCRCIQMFDSMVWNDASTHKQCKICQESTRSCVICERDDCDILANFDVGSEGYADLTGYYCCLHAEYFSQTFNDDRFTTHGLECDVCRPLICETEGLREKLERLEEIEEKYGEIMRGKDFNEIEKERIDIIQRFFEHESL